LAEGLSAAEVGKEIAEHREHGHEAHARRDRLVSIAEAVLLSVVAIMAAWSGYSAAKWGTESSLSLAHASATRTKASLATIEGNQVRTLDSVSFNAVFEAYATHRPDLFRLAVKRLRPGYRPAFDAWLATHPLKNPDAPPGPAYMPQYKVAQEAEGRALDSEADAHFAEGQASAATADKYVRLTVFLAAVLFLVGISSHFPLRSARYGLVVIAAGLLVVSLVQLLGLPGPPP
jgi:hypothetical protein